MYCKQDSYHIAPTDIQRVIEVSAQLFAEKGYDGVGMRLIAKESGVTTSSIFYHFGSKLDLYEEVLEHKYKMVTETIMESISRLTDPIQKLECVIQAFFDVLLKDRAFLMLIHRDIVDVIAHKQRPLYVALYDQFFSFFHTLLKAALGQSAERQVAFSLVSLIQGYCELTAMSNEKDIGKQAWEESYEKQRAYLLDAGKKICSLPV